ncbi:MAG TPA: hypothetical protein DHV28_07695 [Ignavibacteriales bacterium]|nr:hypothetical protein [Ignavibacteriales bacterium]
MFGGGVAHSTNYGANWIALNSGLTNTSVYSVLVKDNIVFAGTFDSGVFYSTNFGTNWIPSNLNNVSVSVFGTDGINLFAGTGNGVYLSTDNGVNWEPKNNGLNNNAVQALAVNGSDLIAGSYGGGIFRSTNNGTSWSPADSGLTNSFIQALLNVGNDLIAGTYGGGVFHSDDNGISWRTINDGLTISDIYSLTADNNYIYAGTGNNVWRRPLSEILTAINDPAVERVNRFYLEQNYPNPFNPSTKIQYAVSSNQLVTLKVYNVLGKEIATLVNEEKSAGNYEIEFNASHLSSGIYFYRLQTGDFVETRKMTLMK